MPVDQAAFAGVMNGFGMPPDARLAVAVSGGCDSMALLLLLRTWAAVRDVSLTVLTVDHGLRDASAAEAKQVASWCAELGVAHVVLSWTEGYARRALSRSPQADARDARYALLLAWCRDHGHGFLCTAHHADDQIETFFLRLTRGSGVDGLAAMAAKSRRQDIFLLRPLLDFSKDQLRATCSAAGQMWVEDPSNQNRASTRVRFRQARALLADEGFDDDRLRATIAHMQRARSALETVVETHLGEMCRWDAWGAAQVDRRLFSDAPMEIGLRALARILIAAAGAAYGPRFERLERLYTAMARGPGDETWRDATLHGCHIIAAGNDFLICREAVAITDSVTLAGGERTLWDGRFHIALPPDIPGHLQVGRLTAAAWKTVRDARHKTEHKPENVPHLRYEVRAGLPMISDNAGVVALPWAAYVRPDANSWLKTPILCEFVQLTPDFGAECTKRGQNPGMWPK
jgi:tRNA(Ile)-lysidine synthase